VEFGEEGAYDRDVTCYFCFRELGEDVADSQGAICFETRRGRAAEAGMVYR